MEKMYSTIEASKVLGVSRMTVFNMIKGDRLRATKVGRNYVIGHHALEEALGRELGDAERADIDATVKRAVEEFGDTLKKLAKE